MAPSGIEPATWFVAQCLNHLRHRHGLKGSAVGIDELLKKGEIR